MRAEAALFEHQGKIKKKSASDVPPTFVSRCLVAMSVLLLVGGRERPLRPASDSAFSARTLDPAPTAKGPLVLPWRLGVLPGLRFFGPQFATISKRP